MNPSISQSTETEMHGHERQQLISYPIVIPLHPTVYLQYYNVGHS